MQAMKVDEGKRKVKYVKIEMNFFENRNFVGRCNIIKKKVKNKPSFNILSLI